MRSVKSIGAVLVSVSIILVLVWLYWPNAEDERAPSFAVELVDSAGAVRLEPNSVREANATGIYVGPQEDPFSSSAFHLGPDTLDKLRTLYFDNIDQARSGDTDAMLLISRVLLNCQYALSFRDQENAWDNFDQALMSLVEYEETVRQINECEPIVQDVLDEFPNRERHEIPFQVRQTWLIRSAEAGNRYARLDLLVDLPGQAEELAGLLDELVDTKDPQVLFKAAAFVSVRSTEEYLNDFEKWAYLGCLNLTSCNAQVFKDNIERTYTQTEQYEIIQFAEHFESLAKSGISFASIFRNEPYTAYTPQQIDDYKNYIRAENKTDVVGASIFFDDEN